MSKYRKWCFTLNNPEANPPDYSAFGADYIIVGAETAPSTGTRHHQGYVRFTNTRALGGVRLLLPAAHWEACKGSETDNIAYCSKEGNIVFENGTREVGQGKRNDLTAVKTCVKSGQGMRAVCELACSYQSMRAAELMLKYLEPGRKTKPFVHWIYGPTGVGKSHTAELLAPDAWISGKNGQWFEGYDAHKNVIFDDIRGDFCPFHVLLRLLDRYPYRVEHKGGSRQFLAETIVITTCLPPEKLYRDRAGEDILQLGRRIDKIVYLPDRATAWEMPGASIGSVPSVIATLPGREQKAIEGLSDSASAEQKCGAEVKGNTAPCLLNSNNVEIDDLDALLLEFA